jgi:hypothetical protein
MAGRVGHGSPNERSVRGDDWGYSRRDGVFEFGWGMGPVLFGSGVNRLGLAVGYGIILGLIAPIGTFLPLVVWHPKRL